MAGARLHDKLRAIAQHDQQAPRPDKRAPAFDDQLEHVLEPDVAADRDGDVASDLEPAHGLLELGATPLGRLVELRVLDRDGRPLSEHHGGLLVDVGELAVALLLGQIEVAPRLSADDDWHAEEAAHDRMCRGKAVARGMLTDVLQTQRPWVLDQHAQDSPAAREVADRTVGLLIDAQRQELVELGALVVQDPERGIAGAGDVACGLEHQVEHGALVKLRHQRPADVQQTPNPCIPGSCRHRCPQA